MSTQRTLRGLIRRLENLVDPSDADVDIEDWLLASGAIAKQAGEALLRHGRADLHARAKEFFGQCEPSALRVFLFDCLSLVTPQPDTLTPAQVAKRYGVRQETVRRWIEDGELQALNLSKATLPRYRVSLDALAAFDRSKSTQPTPKRTPRRKAPPGGLLITRFSGGPSTNP